jgi:hypothetical protein
MKVIAACLILVLAAVPGIHPTPGHAADPQTALPTGWGPVEASQIALSDLVWRKRAVIVFADSPFDPLFGRQMRMLGSDPDELVERDVIVITDTDPAARSDIRQSLRPNGFSLVLIDKDGEAKLRKPLPWDVREITHAIDKFPLRRQEVEELRPAGR